MTKTYTKRFETKAQMNKYYYKVMRNPQIAKAWCGWFKDTGYTLCYEYKTK